MLTTLPFLLSACSGEPSSSGDTVRSYADAVCGVLTKHLVEIQGGGSEEIDYSNPQSVKLAQDRVISAFSAMAREIERIPVPEEVASAHSQLLNTLVDYTEALKEKEQANQLPPEQAIGTVAAIQTRVAGYQLFRDFPESYKRAFRDSEECKRINLPLGLPTSQASP